MDNTTEKTTSNYQVQNQINPIAWLNGNLESVERLISIIRPVKELSFRDSPVKAGMRELKLAYTKLQEVQDWLQEALEEEKYAQAQSK